MRRQALFNALRFFPIQQERKQVNRRKKRKRSQANQKIADENPRAISEFSPHSVSEHFALGKNLDVRHQIIVWANGAAAAFAKPSRRRLFGEAMRANFFCFGQLLLHIGIPWIGFDRRVANPDNQPPEKRHCQTTQRNPADDKIWIACHEQNLPRDGAPVKRHIRCQDAKKNNEEAGLTGRHRIFGGRSS